MDGPRCFVTPIIFIPLVFGFHRSSKIACVYIGFSLLPQVFL